MLNSDISAQEPIAVEIVRGYYSGLLVSSMTGLAGSVLSAVMVQNWEPTSIENGVMFGMPIGMIYGSARGIVGWEDADEKELLVARVGAATPVLVGGLLGSLAAKDRVKGLRNGIFIGQFLAPFGAMLGYHLYKAAVPEQATAKSALLILPVMPSDLSLSDEHLQEDFVFQLVEIKF